jgi:solute carrier family 35 (UDP-sugar transporter), member A1/2/3
MVKQINFGDGDPVSATTNEATVPKNHHGFDLSINAVFILIQTVCSCLAGVYNESLLKDQGKDINIYIQNVFMYIDSILCNALLLLLTGNIKSAFASENLSEMFRPGVMLIAVNSCCIGIVTSFFLKYMNSILKTFASALELVFTAILCWVLFSIPIYLNTILAIAIVSIAVYLYSQSPVVNTAKGVRTNDFEDKRALLTEEDEDDLLQMDQVIVKST